MKFNIAMKAMLKNQFLNFPRMKITRNTTSAIPSTATHIPALKTSPINSQLVKPVRRNKKESIIIKLFVLMIVVL